jgi:hypothetical protein
MVRVLLVVVLAGCVRPGAPPGTGVDPEGPLPKGASCVIDGDCETDSICTHPMGCWPVAELYTAHVSWTINGMPANATTCAGLPPLTIAFHGAKAGQQIEFRPVACAEGKFTLIQVPTVLTTVKLGTRDQGDASATIDTATGEAALDLKL